MVIVSLQAQHPGLFQKWKHPVRIRPEGAEIAEAECAVYISSRDVRKRCLERAPVTVDAADQCEPHHRASGAAAMSGPSICALTLPQIVPYRQHVTHVWCRSSYELSAASSVVPSRASGCSTSKGHTHTPRSVIRREFEHISRSRSKPSSMAVVTHSSRCRPGMRVNSRPSGNAG